MVIPNYGNPVFGAIVRGAEDRFRAAGYSMLVVGAPDPDAAGEHTLKRHIKVDVDGIIMAAAPRHSWRRAHGNHREIPIVFVNRRAERASVPAVVGNDHLGIGLALSHLRELGHENVGHVASPQHISTGYGRLTAFRHWTRELGMASAPVEVATRIDQAAGSAAVTRLLTANPDVSAILAANDIFAMGAYEAVRRTGREVGHDVSIIGYNDVSYLEYMRPSMTAVHVPCQRMGAEAAEVLLSMMGSGSGDQEEVRSLPPSLVVRESTAARSHERDAAH